MGGPAETKRKRKGIRAKRKTILLSMVVATNEPRVTLRLLLVQDNTSGREADVINSTSEKQSGGLRFDKDDVRFFLGGWTGFVCLILPLCNFFFFF